LKKKSLVGLFFSSKTDRSSIESGSRGLGHISAGGPQRQVDVRHSGMEFAPEAHRRSLQRWCALRGLQAVERQQRFAFLFDK
jgi:hypothetical protein